MAEIGKKSKKLSKPELAPKSDLMPRSSSTNSKNRKNIKEQKRGRNHKNKSKRMNTPTAKGSPPCPLAKKHLT